MKNVFSKGKILSLLVVGLIFIGANVIVKAQPGGNEDPIVTKSYVDSQISKLKDYIESKVSGQNNNNNNSQGNEYKVVKVKKGEEIILSGSSEIVLRGGQGSIIDSAAGGIADLTNGIDLRQGYDAPSNHLLLVPISDGRGVLALTDCIFLVKGDYTIK